MKTRRFLGLFLFLLVSLFAFGFNARVKAVETSAAVIVEGAQVRTTGNAGLRFVAVENVPAQEKTAFGIVLAFGEAEVSENFVIGGTVNGKEVVSAEVSETNEGKFMVTLYDIPESMYKQKVSARAYVVADGKYLYAEEVCVRSLAEVVIAAYEKGDESEFVKKVYESLQPAGTTLYYNNAEPQFASFDAFVEEILADFKAAGASSITKETFTTSTGTPVKNVFNKIEMINKYEWLIKFALADLEVNWIANNQKDNGNVAGTYSNSKELLNKLLAGDTSAISGSYANGRTYFRQFIHTLINKASIGDENYDKYDYYISDFSQASNYEAILPNIQASEVVELAENAVLPTTLIKANYTFAGWYDNAGFEGEVVTSHNGASAYYAKYTPTKYTITYNLQGGATTAELVNEYTVETETFALPAASTMSIENGEFVGWYANATGSGDPVTEIAKGTAGNINLYAVWAMAAPTVVELTAADSTVINKYNPTKFVLASATAGNYEINGETYKFGETVFASFSNALSASSKGDVIYVFAGEYTLPDNTTISKSLTILGPNADLGSQEERNNEAKLIFKANSDQGTSNKFNAADLVFNGLVISGVSATVGANYFLSGSSLKNISFISCEITKMSTFNRFQDEGSSIVLTFENCNFNNIGQFIIWSYAGRVSTVNVKGCYFDGASCGGVENTAAALFRIVSGNAYIYNNTFVGDTKKTNGGYFCNRVEGNVFEVKYNTFKDVTKFICASSAKMHTFDNNLYLTGDVAATTSPLAGHANATADTTVCTSAQDLAAKWAEFNK